MNRTMHFTQGLIDCRDKSLVGGKAANLGWLARLGFAVPDGFVVTTRAYRHAQEQAEQEARALAPTPGNGDAMPGTRHASASPSEGRNGHGPDHLPIDVAEEIRAAYRAIGGGPVAVRSSATAEDMAGASMAGQYETFLDIVGEDALIDAVGRCWASINAPRIRVYLREHGIDPSRVAMAVVVQKLVCADVAGVLFTANPHTGTRAEMLVEASWGLGESVVSGRVQPDVLRLEHQTGRVLAATIADKRVHLAAGAGEERPVDDALRNKPCLRSRDVHRLWEVGRRVAEQLGGPQDIEWAIHDGDLYLLQSRPITTLAEAEAYEDLLRGTREFLRTQIKAGRGPWALHNLAETLAHPTPLTWSVISRFMSGSCGFGAMYAMAGFAPAPVAMRDGFLDRVGGRIYMDAARAPEMFFENFPFAYDLEELKRSPDASQTPPTLPRGTFMARMKAGRRLGAVNARLRVLADDFDRKLNAEIFPAFSEWCRAEKRIDLAELSAERVIELFQQRERKVLDEFAPQSLLPSLIFGMALAELRTFVQENFWNDDPDDLSQLISAGGPPNRTVIADAELYEVAGGRRSLEQWIDDHGHRAAGEFDLAAPRWREQPAAAREMADRLAAGADPLERHRQHGRQVNDRIASLRAALPARDRAELDRQIDVVRRYVAFREDGKDFLMLGYDLLRDLALEMGRRLELGEEVFFLTREDLFDSLRVGFAPHHLIDQRQAVHRAEARLSLPRVIDESSIDALGEVAEVKTVGGYKAFAVSSGLATGPACILHSPTEVRNLGRGYILVCPSTDPSWTPLFVNAAGLVLECGGTLSHGAVVAREMGLPAVVLPDATRLFAEGEVIRVDGRRGAVDRAEDVADAPKEGNLAIGAHPPGLPAAAIRGIEQSAVDPDDVRIPHGLIPPPAGRKERLAAKVRNVCAGVWAIYLIAAFWLPEQVLYQPSLRALDWVLWPVMRNLGKPGVVAIVAGGLALLTLVIQKFATDNRRLLEAKRRAARIKPLADALPKSSPRRRVLSALASPVQARTMMAAMVPIGILLGPMVMTFTWFAERVDPQSWNAEAGSAVQVVATVDGEYTQPLTLSVAPPLGAEGDASRTLPPLRATLGRLLQLYSQPAPDDPARPWELKYIPDSAREQQAADLRAFLQHPLPPQGITWQVRAPENLSGRFPVTVQTGAAAPVTVNIVLGETEPPMPATVAGAAHSPIREVKVSYAQPVAKRIFWQPFAKLEAFHRVPGAGKLAALQMGWLWVYVLAYLPVLLIVRWLLRVA